FGRVGASAQRRQHHVVAGSFHLLRIGGKDGKALFGYTFRRRPASIESGKDRLVVSLLSAFVRLGGISSPFVLVTAEAKILFLFK
ncbi:MAG: hypothetical protein K2H70_01915, partial [Bacteroidales bacterium]|nr:hypothetical protein [Bacteroidales bacterium]